jgi:BASS family bile acid:Na+ symporter
MGSTIFAVFLPLALALVMFGLGLTLTVDDFARVLRYPKAAVVALVCQMVLLPAICLGLIYLFRLEGALAVGMMLLVAAPGGPSANLFSHIAGGNVALNITLTAINSILAVFTMPLVVALAYTLFMDEDASIGLRPDKFVQVFAIVLVPAAIGMWVHRRFTAWADRMRKNVKIVSAVVLLLVVVAAVGREFDTLTENIGKLATISLLLSALSFAIGYAAPRLVQVDTDQAIASAMEIGIHNGALAIAVASTVLHNDTMAVPPAVYGVLMNIPAAIAAYLLARQVRSTRPTELAST